MSTAGYPGVPNWLADQTELNRQQSVCINNLLFGRMNNTGSVTLTANVASTTVTLPGNKLGNNTLIVLMPTTANAGTEYGAGNWYITKSLSLTPTGTSTFTINHTNNAQTDRTFLYALIG